MAVTMPYFTARGHWVSVVPNPEGGDPIVAPVNGYGYLQPHLNRGDSLNVELETGVPSAVVLKPIPFVLIDGEMYAPPDDPGGELEHVRAPAEHAAYALTGGLPYLVRWLLPLTAGGHKVTLRSFTFLAPDEDVEFSVSGATPVPGSPGMGTTRGAAADPSLVADAVADYLSENPPEGGGIADLSADTTPSLGGDLDLAGHDIGPVDEAELLALHDNVTALSGLQGKLDAKQPGDADLTALAALTDPAGKLSGIAAGATANATDAYLRDRANHSGMQSSSTISDFTEAAQDAIAALLAGASGVTLSYDDAANSLTITGPGASSALAEEMRDAIGIALIGSGLISITVNDAADTITITTTATANSTDAALRDRGTHTGTQSADTLDDGTTKKAFLATERTKLAGIATGATANSSDATLLASAASAAASANKSADTLTDGSAKVAMTTAERTKLTGVASGATANSSDASLLASAASAAASANKSADTVIDGTTNKTYTATEKTKLSGIAAGATANSSDATLLASAATAAASANKAASTITGTMSTAQIADGSVNFNKIDAGLQDAVTQSTRTGVFQFEHPNGLVAVGPYAISTRRLLSIPHTSTNAGFRVHFRNRDFLNNADSNGNLTGFTAYIGEAAVDANGDPFGNMTAAPVQIQSSTTIVGGAELITGWVAPGTFTLRPNKQYYISYPINVASGKNLALGGGLHWYTATPADAAVAAPAGIQRVDNQGPLDVYVEYQYADDGACSIAVISNSIAGGGNVGTATNRAELGSWPRLWAMRQRGTVMNYAVGGSWAAHYDAANVKWNFYDTLAVPMDVDAVVIFALTSSDITGGTALATVKASLAVVVAKARSKWPNARIILSNNAPRNESTVGTLEDNRVAMNRYLGNCPHSAEACLDIDSLVTDWASPARLRTAYQGDPGVDMTHWSGTAHERAAEVVATAVSRRTLT